MKGRIIEVIVGLGGEIKIDAVGFRGADCRKATEHLEKALGIVRTSTKKGEYYAGITAREQQKLGH